MGLSNDIQSFRKERIMKALAKTGGRIAPAARILEMSRDTLYRWVKVFNLKDFIRKVRKQSFNLRGRL